MLENESVTEDIIDFDKVIYFIEGRGIYYKGHFAPNLIPIEEYIKIKESKDEDVKLIKENKYYKNFFIPFDFKKNKEIAFNTKKKPNELRYVDNLDKIYNILTDGEDSVSSGVNFLISSYGALFDDYAPGKKKIQQIEEQINSVIRQKINFLNFEKIITVGKKPISSKIYDAIFYGEKWSALTFDEKILRIVSSIFFLGIFPVFFYYGNKESIKEAHEINVFPHDYRKYEREGGSIQKVLQNKSFTNENVKKIKEEIKDSKKDVRISAKDNLLFIERFQMLSGKQKFMRLALIFVYTFVLISRLFNLLKPSDNIAPMVSYLTISALVGCLYLTHKKNIITNVLTITSIFILCGFTAISFYNHKNNHTTSYERMFSLGLISLALVFAAVCYIFNRIYKDERIIAKEFNTSVVNVREVLKEYQYKSFYYCDKYGPSNKRKYIIKHVEENTKQQPLNEEKDKALKNIPQDIEPSTQDIEPSTNVTHSIFSLIKCFLSRRV